MYNGNQLVAVELIGKLELAMIQIEKHLEFLEQNAPSELVSVLNIVNASSSSLLQDMTIRQSGKVN